MAARDGEGMTPLHFAYQKGVTRMIDFLIEKGASKDAKTRYGVSPDTSVSYFLTAVKLEVSSGLGFGCGTWRWLHRLSQVRK